MQNEKGQKILVIELGNMSYPTKQEIVEVCEQNFTNYPKDYPKEGYKIYQQLPAAIKALETGKRIFLIKKVDAEEFTLNEVVID